MELLKTEHKNFLSLTQFPIDQQKIIEDAFKSLRAGTRKTYEENLVIFTKWAKKNDLSFPHSEMDVRDFIVDHIGVYKENTVQVVCGAVFKIHEILDQDIPKTKIYRNAMQRFRNETIDFHPHMLKEHVKNITKNDLVQVVTSMHHNRKSIRDKAMMMVCFFGAFRKSELLSIRINDIQRVDKGYLITVIKSKNKNEPTKKLIPYSKDAFCPAFALQELLEIRNKDDQYLFQRISQTGNFFSKMNDKSFNRIIKKYFPGYSPHSLRVGFVTEAKKDPSKNITNRMIMKQTGHTSYQMIELYNRDNDLMTNNAVLEI